MLMLPQEETQSGTTAIFLASCSPPRFVNRQIVSTGRRIYGELGKSGPFAGPSGRWGHCNLNLFH